MRFSISAALVASSLVLTACGPRGPLMVKVAYTPTSKLELGSVAHGGAAIVLAELADEREKPEELGANVEHSPAIPIRGNSSAILGTIGAGISRELGVAGYKIASQAPTVLKITVLEAWVEESNTYEGRVRLRVDILKNGSSHTNLTVTGVATRWGSSLSEENYNEVLSDCIVDAVANLVKSPGFQSSLDP